MSREQKIVYFHETGEAFSNLREASKDLGISESVLSKHLRGIEQIKWLVPFHIVYCSEKFCNKCGVLLNNDNWYQTARGDFEKICKKCYSLKKKKSYKDKQKADPIAHKYRTFKANYFCEFSLSELRKLWKKQDKKCVLCGDDLGGSISHLDHIIPRSQGGLSRIDNLQFLCEKCNRGKFTWAVEEYMNHCKKVANYSEGKNDIQVSLQKV